MKTIRNYALRIPEASAQQIDRLCAAGLASFNQVVCLCVQTALPTVAAKLTPEARITNVDPLPREVLDAYYGRPDELQGVSAAALANFQSQGEPS